MGRMIGTARAPGTGDRDGAKDGGAKDDGALTEPELRFVLDAVPARIWVKDDANRIVWLNAAAAASMSLPQDACIGADTYRLFPAMAAQYHADDLAVLRAGVPRLGHVERYTPANGRVGWVRTDKVPTLCAVTGEPRLVVTSLDVTEQHRAEERLRVANASLDEFASTASHDLRAPLRQIMLLAEMAREDRADPEAVDAHLSDVRDVAARLLSLTERLLEAGKAARVLPEMTPLDLHGPASAAARAIAPRVEALGGEVAVDGHAYAQGDAVLLRQVFANLLENALKYCGDAPPRIAVGLRNEDASAIATVADQGLGIAPEHRERVFEMFKRGAAGRGVQGHGIGLSLCRRVVAGHGGLIEAVEPTAPARTELVVRLPAATADAARAHQDAPARAREAAG